MFDAFSKLSSSETHLTLLGRGTETKMNLSSSEKIQNYLEGLTEPDNVSENPHLKLKPQVPGYNRNVAHPLPGEMNISQLQGKIEFNTFLF